VDILHIPVHSKKGIEMTYSKRTYVYKTVPGCPIQADVYLPPGEERRPAILWLHGGALIFGDRTALPLAQLERYLEAGVALVAIDYRLAPETKLPGILEDVRDAYDWVRNQGPGLFNVDPDRLAVVGHSAGGYLTLMAGFRLYPRPKALVSFYGYGDIVGEWYSRPDRHYNQDPAVSPEAARQGVSGPVIAGSQAVGSEDPRWLFYLYCRQQGLWPQEVAGHDPHTNPRAFDSFCPIRNVRQDYPPTLLLHGDEDTDVPFEQSQQMAAALQEQHVPHRLITMEGLGHGFDSLLDGLQEGDSQGLKQAKVLEAFEAVLAFLKEQIDR
jgi:acetyl esterase/lipase